jgi:hypothetical protein
MPLLSRFTREGFRPVQNGLPDGWKVWSPPEEISVKWKAGVLR